MTIERTIPNSAKEARAIGALRYNTGVPCVRGHLSDRRTSNGECWGCRSERNAQYHLENAALLKVKRNEYQQANGDKIKQQRAANYRENIEREKKRNREYNIRYPEKRKAVKAVRKRNMKQAKPPWMSWGEIQKIYREARVKGLTVDHIVPLNNSRVCGLHVPWNLRLISMAENISKGNKFIEELI